LKTVIDSISFVVFMMFMGIVAILAFPLIIGHFMIKLMSKTSRKS